MRLSPKTAALFAILFMAFFAAEALAEEERGDGYRRERWNPPSITEMEEEARVAMSAEALDSFAQEIERAKRGYVSDYNRRARQQINRCIVWAMAQKDSADPFALAALYLDTCQPENAIEEAQLIMADPKYVQHPSVRQRKDVLVVAKAQYFLVDADTGIQFLVNEKQKIPPGGGAHQQIDTAVQGWRAPADQERDFLRKWKDNPKDIATIQALINLYFNDQYMKNTRDAYVWLMVLKEHFPDADVVKNGQVEYWLGLCFEMFHDVERARDTYRTILRNYSEIPGVDNFKATIEARLSGCEDRQRNRLP
ncbi:MAG: hypothetical protein NUW37_11155 [Planctomycetes bacterium]|nr:hypothetical protein [Planctomycetota bacterium]